MAPYVNSTYKGIPYLHQKLVEAGIVSYKSINNFRSKWLKPLEDKGKLILPRHPQNTRIRLVTEDQIKGIIEAFSPGGKGRYPDQYN